MSFSPNKEASERRLDSIRAAYAKGGKVGEIAAENDVSPGYVSRVCNQQGSRRRQVRADFGKRRG